MLIFLAVVIAVLGVASIFLIPDFKGEIDKNAKLFSLKEAVEAIKHPGVIWACVAYFASTPCTRALPTRPTWSSAAGNADGNPVNQLASSAPTESASSPALWSVGWPRS